MKMSPFIVIRRYLCIFLLGLLDKKKSNRNLPFAFAVNLIKTDVHFFPRALGVIFCRTSVPNSPIFFSRSDPSLFTEGFLFLFQLETSVTLSTPASW